MDYYLNRSEFNVLYERLKTLLLKKGKKRGYKLPGSDIEIIGGGRFSAMKDHFSMKDLEPAGIKNSIYLYNLWLDFQDQTLEKRKVTLKKIDPYFQLIGFKGISGFREEIKNEGVSIHYKCLYYSFPHSDTRYFNLTLTKGLSEINAKTQNFPSHSIGLEGYLKVIDKCLFIYLSNSKHYLTLHIHTASEADRTSNTLPSSKVLQGFVVGTSEAEHPVSFECILIRADKQGGAKNKKDLDEDFALRFLALKRNYYRLIAKGKNQLTASNLSVNNVPVGAIAQMANCTYRIWTYSLEKDYILQSKFQINHNYSSTITTPYGEVLTCLLTINKDKHLRLLAPAYRNNYLAIFAILNIPPLENPDSIVKGAFCTPGNQDKNPVANYFVMCKEDKKFKADKIAIADLEAQIASNPKIADLKKALDHVYRQRGKS